MNSEDILPNDPILLLFKAEATHAIEILKSLNSQSFEAGVKIAQQPLKDLLGAARLTRVVIVESLAEHLSSQQQQLTEAVWPQFLANIIDACNFIESYLLAADDQLLQPSENWLNQATFLLSPTDLSTASATAASTTPNPSPAAPTVQDQLTHQQPTNPSPQITSPPIEQRQIDPGLLELFLEEAREHTANLSRGLVALEQTPSSPQAIEPLMRSAHSLKGASRVVGLDYCVDVAHQAEEVLVQAQHGRLQLTQHSIDVLLAASDYLASAAESLSDNAAAWQQSKEADRQDILRQLERILLGEKPSLNAVAPKVFVNEALAIVQRSELALPATLTQSNAEASDRTSAPTSKSAEQPLTPSVSLPASKETAKANDDGGSVVRVSAKSLSRLMNLAGESLVEARWLQPFANSLQSLKRRQDQTSLLLEDLQQHLADVPASVWAQLQQAKRDLAECRQMLADRIGEFEEHARQSDNLNSRLYDEVIASRMRPFGDLAKGLPRLVRDTARRLDKQVQIEIHGDQTPVDRDILERLEAPLQHLLRNAIDHGVELPHEREAAGKNPIGKLKVEAHHHSGMLYLRVSDDGRGISIERLRKKIVEKQLTSPEMAAQLSEAELLDFIFLPGFSLAEKLTDVSGRGVGLDVVHHLAQSVGGAARTQTKAGEGTTFSLQLPITLSVLRAVLVTIDGEPYALPHNRTERLLRLPYDEVKSLEGRQFFVDNGRNIGLVKAHQLLELPSRAPAAPSENTPSELSIVLVKGEEKSFGITVDAFKGELDLVVRPLDPRLGRIPNLSATAILDNGNPVLILDVEDLLRSIDQILAQGKLQRSVHLDRKTTLESRKKILVVDDSVTVRELQRQLLRQRGYVVDVAVDGLDGLEMARLGNYELIVSDIDMPRMNGLEMIRVLRQEIRTQAVPIIVVSYKGRDEDRQKGMQVGANYYLTKSSFQDDSYLDAVHDLIGDP